MQGTHLPAAMATAPEHTTTASMGVQIAAPQLPLIRGGVEVRAPMGLSTSAKEAQHCATIAGMGRDARQQPRQQQRNGGGSSSAAAAAVEAVAAWCWARLASLGGPSLCKVCVRLLNIILLDFLQYNREQTRRQQWGKTAARLQPTAGVTFQQVSRNGAAGQQTPSQHILACLVPTG